MRRPYIFSEIRNIVYFLPNPNLLKSIKPLLCSEEDWESEEEEKSKRLKQFNLDPYYSSFK